MTEDLLCLPQICSLPLAREWYCAGKGTSSRLQGVGNIAQPQLDRNTAGDDLRFLQMHGAFQGLMVLSAGASEIWGLGGSRQGSTGCHSLAPVQYIAETSLGPSWVFPLGGSDRHQMYTLKSRETAR